jgi:hypothetical protein
MSSLGMHQLTKDETKIPKIGVGLLLGILVFGMFMGVLDRKLCRLLEIDIMAISIVVADL